LVIEHPFGIINMDVACVKVILHNLVSNAIKFTDKGSITVKVNNRKKIIGLSKLKIQEEEFKKINYPICSTLLC